MHSSMLQFNDIDIFMTVSKRLSHIRRQCLITYSWEYLRVLSYNRGGTKQMHSSMLLFNDIDTFMSVSKGLSHTSRWWLIIYSWGYLRVLSYNRGDTKQTHSYECTLDKGLYQKVAPNTFTYSQFASKGIIIYQKVVPNIHICEVI